MKRVLSLAIWVALFFFSISSRGQSPILDIGVRLQKTVNLYMENGVAARYSSPQLMYDKLYFGFTYFTSRLGTAWGTNAIKQDNILLSASYYIRKDKIIRPFAGVNVGYFHASYEYKIFRDLDNQSVMLSPEFGINIDAPVPFKANVSFGYNLITGNGVNGAGTLYPLYVQTTLLWRVLRK